MSGSVLTTDKSLIELLDLDTFGAWVDAQDPNREYTYRDTGSYTGVGVKTEGCALVQYFREHGYDDVAVTRHDVQPFYHSDSAEDKSITMILPYNMNYVVEQNPSSNFGGIAKNIKTLKEKGAELV